MPLLTVCYAFAYWLMPTDCLLIHALPGGPAPLVCVGCRCLVEAGWGPQAEGRSNLGGGVVYLFSCISNLTQTELHDFAHARGRRLEV